MTTTKEQIWPQFCRQVGGTYVKGSFWKSDKAHLPYKNRIMTLDTCEEINEVEEEEKVTYFTRLRIPFVNLNDFNLNVLQAKNEVAENFQPNITIEENKWEQADNTDEETENNKLQQIDTGFPKIDQAFVVQSNCRNCTEKLLSSPNIQQLLLANPDFTLHIQDDEGWFGVPLPDNVNEIYIEVKEIITDLKRLEELYAFALTVFNVLCEMKVATTEDPKVII